MACHHLRRVKSTTELYRKERTSMIDQTTSPPSRVDPCAFQVSFITTTPTFTTEPSEYVTEIRGQILLEEHPTDLVGQGSCSRRCAGHIALSLYDLARALDDGQELMQVVDCMSEPALELYQALYDEGGELRSEVGRALEPAGATSPSLLVIEAVEVLPRYRGGDLALAAALKAMHVFGPAGGLVALLAAPLQRPFGHCSDLGRWRRRMKMDDFPADSPAVRAKLGDYWSRLGFAPVEPAPADYYVRGLGKRLPTVAELVAGQWHTG
jgi:hypothetical protein